MPKNTSIEVTKIEDFIMEDDKFTNLGEWYESILEDLKNVAYRTSDGNLRTDINRKTNLILTQQRKDALRQDLEFRYELQGETARLKEIERRLIGKYRIDVIGDSVKKDRLKILQKFINYFNDNEVTNKIKVKRDSNENLDVEVELSLEDAIRRGIIIASIDTNKKLSLGTVIGTFEKYPVKGINRGMIGKELGANRKIIDEFISFYEDKTIDDLKKLLFNEFPDFKFTSNENEETIYDAEYFFPVGEFFPEIVYYENKTLNTEGEFSLLELIRKFKVKSNPELMEIFDWMISHQPTGPKFPKSTNGNYILVITNRPSSLLRLTEGTPWATQGACTAWSGSAGPQHPDYGGGVSGWTGWTDIKHMNLIAFIFSNGDGKNQPSDLQDINSDWPIVYDDTLVARSCLRWGYVSKTQSKDSLFKEIKRDDYDDSRPIGFSIEPWRGMSKHKDIKPITIGAILEVLDSANLSERNWKSLVSPHRFQGATDRSKPPNASGGVTGPYGNQYADAKKSVIDGYYLDEKVDVFAEQKSIATSNTLSIGDAKGLAKRRIPVEIRNLLAQNPRIWLYPSAVEELIRMKNYDTNMILLGSPLCNTNYIFEIFNSLSFFDVEKQKFLIQAVMNSSSFNSSIEERLINYLLSNQIIYEKYFNKFDTYKKINKTFEEKINYGLFLLTLSTDIYTTKATIPLSSSFGSKYKIVNYPYSINTINQNIDILEEIGKKIKRKRRGSVSNRNLERDFLTLSNTLLFAQNINTTNYIRVIKIMTDILTKDNNETKFPSSYGLSGFSMSMVAISYLLNYNGLNNNQIRNYNIEISKFITNRIKLEEVGIVTSKSIPTIESFILSCSDKSYEFTDRQITDDGELSLYYVLEYYLALFNDRGAKDDQVETMIGMVNLGLYLLLNSNEKTLQYCNSIQDLEELFQQDLEKLLTSKSSYDFQNNMRILLLSNTINYENNSWLGEKLIINPVERLNLFRGFTNPKSYFRIFNKDIRKMIQSSIIEDKKLMIYKEDIENYILEEIMENKLYTIIPRMKMDGYLKENKNITSLELSTYLTQTEQIENLFNEVLQVYLGAFSSEITYIQRNPLPSLGEEELLNLDIEEFDELNTLIDNVKQSQEWQKIDFGSFLSHLNYQFEGKNFGFVNNNYLPSQIQNFIANDIEDILIEYGVADFYANDVMNDIFVQLALNNNLSLQSIEKMMQTKYLLKLSEIKRNLANNNNTPIKYLISENLNYDDSLFNLYPYEVLLNNQISANKFYELYNRVFELITTKVGDRDFDWENFMKNKIEKLMAVEKGSSLRKKMEEILYDDRKEIDYWRGGYNLSKKFKKELNTTNLWLMSGGAGGITDYPITPNPEYQKFGILKWSSDKNKNEMFNIKKHKNPSKNLLSIEGVKTFFNEQEHLQSININENTSINDLFGFIPEDEREPNILLKFCNDCFKRTTAAGKPIKYKFENQEAIDNHLALKHEEGEEVEILEAGIKTKKWTHDNIFLIQDNRPANPKALTIPAWRTELTEEIFNNLINSLAIKIGSLELYDRISPSLPIRCQTGKYEFSFTIEDMLKNINQSQSWSVDFIDDNLDLICNQVEQNYQIVDMWNNFIITDNFITYSLTLFNDKSENYQNLMLYLLNLVDLNRIEKSVLKELSLKINDVNLLVSLDNFLL
jgi:hypothetical protein